MDELATLQIGHERNGFKIIVNGLAYPASTCSSDREWLSITLKLWVGKFHAEMEDLLSICDIQNFRKQVHLLIQLKTRCAEFKTMEDWLRFSLPVDKCGHIICEGYVSDQHGMGNRLEFEFEIDQSYLSEILKNLDAIISQF